MRCLRDDRKAGMARLQPSLSPPSSHSPRRVRQMGHHLPPLLRSAAVHAIHPLLPPSLISLPPSTTYILLAASARWGITSPTCSAVLLCVHADQARSSRCLSSAKVHSSTSSWYAARSCRRWSSSSLRRGSKALRRGSVGVRGRRRAAWPWARCVGGEAKVGKDGWMIK